MRAKIDLPCWSVIKTFAVIKLEQCLLQNKLVYMLAGLQLLLFLEVVVVIIFPLSVSQLKKGIGINSPTSSTEI